MSKSLVTALVLAAIATGGAVSSVQANPVWVFPNKGTPHVLPESQSKHRSIAQELRRHAPGHQALVIKGFRG